MEVSPRKKLYRRLAGVVTCGAALLLAVQFAPAQYAQKKKATVGPRALGLLEIAPGGKAHLVPITIMYQGQFYDASAYKANPVPMALDSQTVYEAERAGESQGLFTVTDARRLKNSWLGDGEFVPKGAEVAKKKVPEFKPPSDDADLDKPPILRRPGSEKPKPPVPASSAPNPTASTNPPAPTPTVTTAPAPARPANVPPADPDRPVLRRGPQPEKPEQATATTEDTHPAKTSSPAPTGKPPTSQMMPAISDAKGPEPRSYAYDAKPEEEQKFRKRMLAFASDAVLKYYKQLESQQIEPEPHPTRKSTAAKSQQPAFTDVELHIFDLTSSNVPILVLTANATLPTSNANLSGMQYSVAIVARDDIYDQLHTSLNNVTDNRHLDVAPQMQLIDAVDADGDGRGELLFRDTSDQGKYFVIYRVIGDQLYPLFQGSPS